MNELLIATQKTSAVEVDPYYNLVSLHLKGDVNTGRSYNAFSDASSNNFRLTNSGDVRGSSFSPYGTSWSGTFNGSSDYLSVAAPTMTGNWTIEFWWYPTVGGATSQAFFTATDSANSVKIHAWSSNNQLIIDNGVTGQSSFTNVNFTLNQWNHIAFVRNGATTSGYINGVFAGSNSFVPGSGITQCRIGSNIGVFFVAGQLSNFRVVDGVAVYSGTSTTTANFAVPTSPLSATQSAGTNIAAITGTATSILALQSNRFVDQSSSPKTITVNGSPRISSFSPFLETDTTSGSGYFDGTGDYLQTASNAAFDLGTGNFTLEFWVNPTGISQTFISRQSSASGWGNIQWYLNIDASGTLILSVSNGSAGANVFANPNIPRNAWSHVAIVRNTNIWYVYLNGVSQTLANGTSYSSSMEANATGQPFNIGGFTGWGLTTGNIADVRLVKGVPVYTGNFTPPTKPLSRSGSASASAYPSTTNVNTTFAESATSILTLQERGAYNTIGFEDDSENDFPITRSGNVAQGTFSPFSNAGWSAYYDGTTDNLTIASQAGLGFGTGDFCVEFWAYRLNTNAFVVLLQLNTYNTGLYIRTESTTYNDSFYFMNSSMNWDPATNFPANTWTHICVTRQTGKLRFFVNGKLIVSADNTSNMGAATADVGTSGFSGYLSNVRVIKGSVPAAYQTSNTTAGSQIFTPPTAPLTAVTGTELLTCQSNRLVDANTQTTPKAITRNGDVAATAFSPFLGPVYDPVLHGGSAYFDGTADVLTVPDNTLFDLAATNFVIEAWAYSQSSTNFKMVVGQWNSGSISYTLRQNAGKWVFTYTTSTATTTEVSLTAASAQQLNSWAHLVVIRTGTALSLYVNGTREATATLAAGLIINNNTGAFSVGGGGTGSDLWVGYIGPVRLVRGNPTGYDATLTTVAVPTGPLVASPNTVFQLNFTNGGVIDSTGKNVIETVGNAGVVTTAIKKYGSGSLQFDGSADALVIPSSSQFTLGSSGANFTIEGWIYPTGTPGTDAVIAGTWQNGSTTYANRWFLSLRTSGTAVFWWDSTGSPGISYTGISLNQWTHIAVVRSAGTITLYVNGVARGTQTANQAYTTQDVLRIGGGISGASDFPGYMDDFRITLGLARYTANFTPPTKALPDRGTLSTLTSDLAAPSSVEALVVAGGGGGGSNRGGGGGAGGFREFIGGNAIAVSANTNYPLTIGAGGASGLNATKGQNSVFSTITSEGGGGGAGYPSPSPGNTGGSGGGVANPGTGGPASTSPSGQGNAGGNASGVAPYYGASGGGGAGAVGGTGTATAAGNGGVGLQSSITGVSPAPYYAGGGGGGIYNTNTPSSGGLGGGGAGGSQPTNTAGGAGGNGTANTGGGAGGGGTGSNEGPGGTGGSGIVILAYPTTFKPLKASLGLVYTIDTVTRPGYRVYKFVAGTGTISW